MARTDAAKKIAQKLSNKVGTDEAQKILAKYDDVDVATKLQGAEKQQYLDALDAVYGDKVSRASEMGIDQPKLQKLHDKALGRKKEQGYSVSRFGEVDYTDADDGAAEAFLSKNPELRPRDYSVGDSELRASRTQGADTIHVNDVNVDPEQKRKGIATSMYLAAERDFKLPMQKGVTGLSDESRALWNNPDRPFGHPRHPDANFDPRFKDSANILALDGSQAPKIAKGMIKPSMNLMDAASAIAEPAEKLDEATGATKAVNSTSDTLTNIAARIPRYFENMIAPFTSKSADEKQRVNVEKQAEKVRPAVNLATNIVAPVPSNLMFGGALKVGKGLGIAKKMATAEPVIAKSAAELYREAKAGIKANGWGTVVATPDAVQPIGKVRVIP